MRLSVFSLELALLPLFAKSLNNIFYDNLDKLRIKHFSKGILQGKYRCIVLFVLILLLCGFPTLTAGSPALYSGGDAVMLLDFNEGNGSVAHDSSGNNNNLVLNGAGWVNCSNSSALFFDGLDDYGINENPSNFNFSRSNGITISVWFKLLNHSGQDGIVSINGDDCCIYRIMVDSMHPFYDAGSHTDQTIKDYVFVKDVWYHYAMTIVGNGSAVIYINGKPVHNSPAGVPTVLPDGREVLVGVGEKPSLHHTSGIIDDVIILNRALTPEDMESLYEHSGHTCGDVGIPARLHSWFMDLIPTTSNYVVITIRELVALVKSINHVYLLISIALAIAITICSRSLSASHKAGMSFLGRRFRPSFKRYLGCLEFIKKHPFVMLLPIVLCQVYVLHWMFKDGFLMGDGIDITGHQLRVKFTIDALRHFRIDGWFPYWYNGFQLYQFYSPFFFVSCGVIYLATFGFMGLANSFKLSLLLAYIAQAVFIYVFIRLLGYRLLPSLTAAAFSLSAHFYIGYGVDGLLSQTTQSFAMVFVPLALGLSYVSLRGKAFYTIPAGVFLAVTMLSHPISGVFSFIAVGLLFIVDFLSDMKLTKVIRFIFIMAIGFLLSTLWTIPMAYHINEMGLHSGWLGIELGQEYAAVLGGGVIGDRALVYMGLLGVLVSVCMVVFKRDHRAFYLLALCFVVLVMTFGLIRIDESSALGRLFFVRWMTGQGFFYKRGMIFIAMLFPIFAGVAVDAASMLTEMLSERKKVFVQGMLTGILIYLFFFHTLPYAAKYKSALEGNLSGVDDYRQLMGYIKENTPEASLIGLEIPSASFSLNTLECNLPLFSDRAIPVGCQNEGTNSYLGRTAVFSSLASSDSSKIACDAARYGVDYLLTVTSNAAKKLNHSEYFTVVYSNSQAILWEVSPPTGEIRVVDKHVGFNSYVFTVESDYGGVAVLPVSYSGRWFITVNDKAVSFNKTYDNLIQLYVPSGRSTVRMVYTMDAVDMLSYGISLATAIVLVIVLAYPYVRRRFYGTA